MCDPLGEAAVTRHYSRLAQAYDRRWRGYLWATLQQALDALPLRGTERILDVGCGTGEFERMAIERHPTLELVGVDVTSAMLELARQKLAGSSQVRFHLADAESLPFEPEQFDVVVTANMLHHVRQPRQFLEECTRVLRPHGRLVLVDWCRDFWHCRLLHVWLSWVDRAYTRMHRLADVTALVEGLGLTVTTANRFRVPPAYGMMRIAARKLVWGPT